MRRIIKNSSPTSFENWKQQFPTRTFSDLRLSMDVKRDLKQSLFDEQYGLCGYCCAAITLRTSHIEHIVPQCSGTRQLDYQNLICSCNGYQVNRNTCGHKKDNVSIAVSPLDPNCESRFKYTSSGKILPANQNDTDAQNTIDTLNLNSYELVTARKGKTSLLIHNLNVTPDNKNQLIAQYSTPKNGVLEAFSPMCVYVINNFL